MHTTKRFVKINFVFESKKSDNVPPDVGLAYKAPNDIVRPTLRILSDFLLCIHAQTFGLINAFVKDMRPVCRSHSRLPWLSF